MDEGSFSNHPLYTLPQDSHSPPEDWFRAIVLVSFVQRSRPFLRISLFFVAAFPALSTGSEHKPATRVYET